MSSLQLKEWMRLASTAEQEELAFAANTSRQQLYALTAMPNSSMYRRASNELAARLEEAVKSINARSNGRLPPLTRGDLNYGCAECPYFLESKCKEK